MEMIFNDFTSNFPGVLSFVRNTYEWKRYIMVLN